MSKAEDVFNELAAEVDYSMLIVTTAVGDRMAGCLVGFATQCSIDPPRYLVCLSKNNRTLRLAELSDALLVHFPSSDAHELVELFGAATGDDIDKFAQCRWHRGPRGLPVLDGSPRWFAGEILDRMLLGDHCAFLLSPFAAQREGSAQPYLYHRVRQLEAGHDA